MWRALGADVQVYSNSPTKISCGTGYDGDRRQGYIIELVERAHAQMPTADDVSVLRQAIVLYAADRPARSLQDLASAIRHAAHELAEKMPLRMHIDDLDSLVDGIATMHTRLISGLTNLATSLRQ